MLASSLCIPGATQAAHGLSTLPMGAVAHTYPGPNFKYVREWLSWVTDVVIFHSSTAATAAYPQSSFSFLFKDRVMLCSPGWSKTQGNLCASA